MGDLARVLGLMRDPKAFGRALKAARLRAGLPLRGLAREAGIAPPTVMRVEAWKHAMTTATFEPLLTWLLAATEVR